MTDQGAPDYREVEYRRQAAFRRASETISARGRLPTDDAARDYRYMLALGLEDENLYPPLRGTEGARRFFGERGIKWWRHCGFDDPSADGPTRNMASSQIACVNFFLPLAGSGDDGLLAVLTAIDDDVTGIVRIENPTAGTSSTVEFEWIGLGHALEGEAHTTRGKFATSIDAVVVAETRVGRRAYLLEWKYTESYGENDKGRGQKGRTRRRWYGERYAASPAFRDGIPLDAWLHEPFYQIMRQRLLADRMVAKEEMGVSEAKVVLIVPDGNVAYRSGITSPVLQREFPDLVTVEDVVRATMNVPDRDFGIVSQAVLADAARAYGGPQWSRYQRERYGW